MTTDADLTELLAQKLHEVDPISGHDPRWDRLLKMDREWYRIKATAVLPILRRAQAEAWDEGQESGWGSAREESDQHGGVCDMWKPHVWLEPNPHREEQNR